MSLGRAMLRLLGGVIPAQAGYRPLSGRRVSSVANAAGVTLTVSDLAAGVIARSGAVTVSDTLPTVDAILAAFPDLSRGDSFEFTIINSNTGTLTIVAGTGWTLAGTTTIATVLTRNYLATLTSDAKRTVTVSGSTTNTGTTLTNIPTAQLANIGIGMAVTGTGIGASALVTAVNQTAGTVTVSVASTATADNVGITFTPQAELRGLQTSAL